MSLPDKVQPLVPVPADTHSDKLWHKTGSIFIETSKDGAPSGLMTAGAEYRLQLLDGNQQPVSSMVFDTEKLAHVLDTLQSQGKIILLTKSDAHTTGYLLPLSLLPDVLQKMSGTERRKGPSARERKHPIVITTDGSFRDGGQGGGHVILERLGSDKPRDDFRITLTWQATIKDSYESELRGVLEALKYLEHGGKSCHLVIRCDHLGLVNMLNDMSMQQQRIGHIAPISRTKPCAEIWEEISEKISHHSFEAEHARYDQADPNTIECHRHANHAARQWKRRGQGGQQHGHG